MKKRLFAVLLAACLMLSLVPAPAFAAEESTPIQNVQALIDDLPAGDTITAENRKAVEAQLTAIDGAKAPLTDEERATLDFTKYNAAIAAINVLDNQPGAEVPQPIPDGEVTVTFWCDEAMGEGTAFDTLEANNKGIIEKLPPEPSVDGYEFLGWYTEPNGGGKKVDGSTIFTKDTDLYAYMKRTRTTGFTITFDPQGGTLPEGVANTTITDLDGKLTGSLPTPTRDGFEFDGWHAYIENVGTYFDRPVLGSSIFGEDMTIYAQWKKIKADFSLSGYGNGLAVSGLKLTSNDDDVTVVNYSVSDDKEGTNVLADSHTFTREKVYYVKVTLSLAKGIKTVNKFTLNGADCVYTQDDMTVVFQLPTVGYAITLDPNGGKLSEGTDSTVATDADGKLTSLPTPTRDGYAFAGWYMDKEDGDEVAADKVYSENTILYAHWNPNHYDVRFDANGGTGEMDNQHFAYNDKKALYANTFICSSKKFLGWNTKANGTGTDYADKATVEGLTAEDGGIVILYAQWGDAAYTVRFHANGGTGTMADQSLTCGTSQNLTANAFAAPTGYKFQYWSTNTDGTGTHYDDKATIKDLSKTDGDVIDLYAQWTANTYTVRFNANGGKGTTKDMTLAYGKGQNLTANAFTFAGHKFRCWTTKADGTGMVYLDGESVENLSETDGDVITLYAQWDVLVQKVEMKLSGHTYEGRVDSVKVKLSSDGVSLPGATYDGSWGITTSKSKLTTLSGKLFRADQQYYLWVKFQANDGYLLDSLKAENVFLDGTTALSLTKDSGLTVDGEQKPTTLTAVFRLPVIYTIETSAGKNGTISPEDTIVVFEGENATIKITPDKDYVVYRLKVDGQTVKTARTYTFENIQESHTIRATFLKNGSNAKTGDSFPLVPAIAVLALSAVALTAIFVIAKKKKEQ